MRAKSPATTEKYLQRARVALRKAQLRAKAEGDERRASEIGDVLAAAEELSRGRAYTVAQPQAIAPHCTYL